MESESPFAGQPGRRAETGGRIDLAHADDFAIGRLQVRPSTREVICDGATHVIEPRVMQVLVALACANGAILSRDDLTRCCWDDRIVGEDAINRVISRLRRLAEECGSAFHVETITRVGYRLIRDDAGSRSKPTPVPHPSRVHGMVFIAIVMAVAVSAALIWVGFHHQRGVPTPKALRETVAAAMPADPMPADADTAALYLQARQDWALRRSDSIRRAIGEFGAVITRDPGYAPAYSGLADAYILAREFGTLDDAEAFPRAKAAAAVALRIDPAQVGALRATGFVDYWWGHDPPAAGRAFRRAIALAPSDPQSHFWYANILADNGEFVPADKEFDAARALNPESIPIQADRAWAVWSEGKRDEGVSTLEEIARTYPQMATPHDALYPIYLAEHDYPRYVRELATLARLRQSADLEVQARNEANALAQGHAAFAKMLLRDNARSNAPRRGDQAWPAFAASSVGDRAALLAALVAADRRGETWGSAGEVRQISQAWSTDAEIMWLLKRRKSSSIV